MIVEMLHARTGQVQERRRVDVFPFTIGRALDRSLVLDDPYADATHAELVPEDGAEGSLLLVDRGSVNGVRTITGERAERLRIRHGAEVVIGRTRLRFRDAEAPLPPALSLGGASRAGAWYEHPLARLGALALAFGAYAYSGWVVSVNRSAATDALSMGIGLLGLAAVWGGIWAAVARLVIHEARFLAHYTLGAMAMVSVGVITTAGEWFQFLFPAREAFAVVTGVASLGLLVAVVAAHLKHASHLSPRRRWRAGLLTAGITLAIAGAYTLVEDDSFTDVPEFSSAIKAAPLAIVPTTSPEAFRTAMVGLRDEVDELAAQPVGRGNGGAE